MRIIFIILLLIFMFASIAIAAVTPIDTEDERRSVASVAHIPSGVTLSQNDLLPIGRLPSNMALDPPPEPVDQEGSTRERTRYSGGYRDI